MMKSKFLVALSIVLGSLGQLLMKNGMNSIGEIDRISFGLLISVIINPFVLSGIIIYIISMFLWLAALKKLDLSYAYPFLSLGYILVAFFSWRFFNETISLYRWIGIALIVFGVSIFSYNKK